RGRRHAEGDDVGKRVELAAEQRLFSSPARNAPIEDVEHERCRRERDRRDEIAPITDRRELERAEHAGRPARGVAEREEVGDAQRAHHREMPVECHDGRREGGGTVYDATDAVRVQRSPMRKGRSHAAGLTGAGRSRIIAARRFCRLFEGPYGGIVMSQVFGRALAALLLGSWAALAAAAVAVPAPGTSPRIDAIKKAG